VEDLDGRGGTEHVLPLGLAHARAQHQEQRPQTFPARGERPEGRLDQIGRGALCDPREQALDLVDGLEGRLRYG
jgi:hypothetical protein